MKHRADLAFRLVALSTLVFALITLAALVFDVVADGAGRLSWQFLTSLASRNGIRAGWCDPVIRPHHRPLRR